MMNPTPNRHTTEQYINQTNDFFTQASVPLWNQQTGLTLQTFHEVFTLLVTIRHILSAPVSDNEGRQNKLTEIKEICNSLFRLITGPGATRLSRERERMIRQCIWVDEDTDPNLIRGIRHWCEVFNRHERGSSRTSIHPSSYTNAVISINDELRNLVFVLQLPDTPEINSFAQGMWLDETYIYKPFPAWPATRGSPSGSTIQELDARLQQVFNPTPSRSRSHTLTPARSASSLENLQQGLASVFQAAPSQSRSYTPRTRASAQPPLGQPQMSQAQISQPLMPQLRMAQPQNYPQQMPQFQPQQHHVPQHYVPPPYFPQEPQRNLYVPQPHLPPALQGLPSTLSQQELQLLGYNYLAQLPPLPQLRDLSINVPDVREDGSEEPEDIPNFDYLQPDRTGQVIVPRREPPTHRELMADPGAHAHRDHVIQGAQDFYQSVHPNSRPESPSSLDSVHREHFPLTPALTTSTPAKAQGPWKVVVDEDLQAVPAPKLKAARYRMKDVQRDFVDADTPPDFYEPDLSFYRKECGPDFANCPTLAHRRQLFTSTGGATGGASGPVGSPNNVLRDRTPGANQMNIPQEHSPNANESQSDSPTENTCILARPPSSPKK